MKLNVNIIKDYFNKQKEKNREKHIVAIKSEFRVTERDGRLWITHLGCAIKEVEENKKASDVAMLLNQIRDTSIAYEILGGNIKVNNIKAERYENSF